MDFDAITGLTLSFSGSTIRRCINVDINDDSLFEADEVLGVMLSSPSINRVTLSPDEAEVTIVDDDGELSTELLRRE